MSKKEHSNSDRYPPEFQEWLKVNRVPRKVRKDPEALRQQYQEWRKRSGKEMSKRRSLFRIPNIQMDLGTIVNQVRTVSELLETLHQAGDLLRSPKNDKDDLI